MTELTDNPHALYKTREEALTAPGYVYTHFKGGIYREVKEVEWQAGEFQPKQGDSVIIYEHLWPHEHSYFARDERDFQQQVEKPEYGYSGRRFKLHSANVSPPMAVESFECECSSSEHTFKFVYDQDDEWRRDLYLIPYLSTHRNFFERLVYAFKYVFGWQQDRGAFDEVILREHDLLRLKAVVDTAVDQRGKV